MPRQSDLRFTFSPASDDSALEVVSFALTEGLSEPFRLVLELSSQDAAIDFGRLLDRPAGLTLWRDDAPVRHVHGIVTSFEQRDTGFRRTRYSAIVEPVLARAGLASDWRTFQQVSVPDIVAGVLKAQGIVDNRVQLSTTHLAREYAVQAGETNLAFTARLLSEEGIVYAFEHRDGGHTLVHTDNVQSLGCIGGEPVLYNAEHSGDQGTPCLWRFTYAEHVRTAQQAQRDYSFRQPQYDQQHVRLARDLEHQGDRYERYDYPGRYKEVAAGAPFTTTRLLARRADAQRATVEGDDARLRVGLGFELVGHHREEMNQLWRPVRITHHGVQHSSQEEDGAGSELGTQYRLTAELVAAATEWKAPLCPKPRIDGPQMATVVGPPGEEIYCDALGRVRVQFPWDRVGKRDDHSSCWVRVAQQWAGPAWGHMAIPRVGHEVIVDFLDGDPDQPIVTGRTYHAANLPPYKLPDFKTVSPVRSKEHRGNRANELRLDDTTEQISAALMSDHAHSALHLGYLTHPRPRGGEPRGEGFELRSDGSGAMRAAKGLLLTTDGQTKATGGQLSRDELIRCLQGALDLAKGLGDYAAQHNGAPHDAAPQQALRDAVSALSHGANDDRQGTGGGEPVIALSSPAGIAAATPRSVTLAAGQHIDSVAELNQQITAGKDIVMNAGGDLGVFVHGGNLSQIAHQGDLTLEAQKQNIRLHADKSVQVSASHEHVLVTAETHITLMCGGAFIKMGGGDIEMVMPGTFKVRAAVYDMDAGSSASVEPTETLVDEVRRQFIVDYTDGGGPVANQPYRLTLASGEVISGVTDALGATELIERSAMHDITLALQGASTDNAS